MAELKFSAADSLEDILKKIKATEGEKITLVVDADSEVLTNPMNFRILEQVSAEEGKEINLSQVTPQGQVEEVSSEDMTENLGFVEESVDKVAEKDTLLSPKEEKVSNELATETEELSLTPEVVTVPMGEEPQFGIQTDPTPPAEETLAPVEALEKSPGILPAGLSLGRLNLDKLKTWRPTRRQLIIGGVGGGFLLLFFTLFYLLPSAEVKLFVAGQNLEKTATVSATPRLNEIDVNTASIPLTTVEVKQSGSLQAKATGKKNIGDAAKGKVELRNYSTDAVKSLPKGTIMRVVGKSPALEFSLDRAVTVPTATKSSGKDANDRDIVVTDPGRLEVEATAAKLGTEGNITSKTRLAINGESLALIEAGAVGDFSGGTSKEVTVVSASDRNSLLATLSAQLKDKASEEVKAKLEQGQKLPDGGIETEEIRKVFSRDIDQEASEVSLNLEVKAIANVYNEKDLAKLLSETLKTDLPEGFKIDDSSSGATAEVLKVNEDKTVTLLAKIDAKLVPDLDIDEISKNLSGKSIDKAKSYLQTLQNIDDVEINLQPAILNFLKSFPTNGSKIKIEIVPTSN
jgi:hypothetical protein